VSALERELVMPVKSEKQRRFMEIIAHGKVKKKGLGPSDARKFLEHKGKK
jgi:hypothetical protein